MAPRQANRNIEKVERQRSVPKDETRPQGVKKERPQLSARKSVRLQERIVSKNTNPEPMHPLPSPTSNIPGHKFPQVKDRKRRRSPPLLLLPLKSGRGRPLQSPKFISLHKLQILKPTKLCP
ncbi:hypothetical protein BDZ45DRAFT_310290 [Acephala macrosclerotiorum]|nr:hypothetical protein BDZ45DRAFT_310290 [Acephala macrosclerotiorum]